MDMDLEQQYDGPPPRLTRAVLRAGGRQAWLDARRRADLARAEGECAEARLGAARRRAQVAADRAPADPWLHRLTRRLAAARGDAVDLRGG